MIVMFSIFSPASVTLYWVVGGFMMILQQFIVNYMIRPKLRKKYAKNCKEPTKASKTSGARKDVTPESAAVISTSAKKNKKRNSGKQHSR